MNPTGHIKAGELTLGIVGSTAMKLTETGKIGENFVVYPGYETGVKRLKVKLAFPSSPKDNFQVSKISFVLVNNIYKYKSIIKSGYVYLLPIQPNFSNPLDELPTIKLGTVAKWEDKLQMKLRGIGYFRVDGEIMDFKTLSAFSITEITQTLGLISLIPFDRVINQEFDLVYKTKLFKTDKIEQVSYVTLSQDLISGAAASAGSTKEISWIKALDKKLLSLDSEKIATAITQEEYIAKYGKECSIKVDSEALSDFGEISIQNVEAIAEKKETAVAAKKEIEKILEANEDLLIALKAKGIPEPITRALIKNFEKEAFAKAESVNFSIPDLVKMISARA